MKESQNQITKIFLPVKLLAGRFTLIFLILFSVAIIPISRFDQNITPSVRVFLIDAFTPIFNVISHPVYFAKNTVSELNTIFYLRSEVKRLTEENEKLMNWQQVGYRLTYENNSLRELLNVSEEPAIQNVSARIIADTSGLFVRTFIINAGSANGVKKGQAVVSSRGLVGRVSEAGIRSSRVLQITDMNSKIPVIVSPSNQRAILAGDNSDNSKLLFLTDKNEDLINNYVLTSGHGGLFPPGIRIGTVSQFVNGSVRVRPFVNWSQVEYVKVLSFSKD
ncbi:MAG: rod shape-determining protein MreC [Rhodospirillaceae bacterium]|nr:rod shape-determining protein MreC [Rhodospirillaceae bacterium]